MAKPQVKNVRAETTETDFPFEVSYLDNGLIDLRRLSPNWPVNFNGDYPKVLKLAQQLTQEVQDGAAEAGQYVIANTILPGFDTLTVIPVAYQHTWLMMDEDDNVVKKSADNRVLYCADGTKHEKADADPFFPTDPDTQWINDKKPKCQPGHTFLFFIPALNLFVTFTFQSSAYAVGRKVLEAFNLFGPGRAFITLGSTVPPKAKRPFYLPTARAERNVTEPMKEAREDVQRRMLPLLTAA